MRVLAGALKGRRLVTPGGRTTRPTADQVRIACLDALMPFLAAGPFLDAGPSKLAIVGGTGRYAGARGWMNLRARNKKGTEYDFVFHVS